VKREAYARAASIDCPGLSGASKARTSRLRWNGMKGSAPKGENQFELNITKSSARFSVVPIFLGIQRPGDWICSETESHHNVCGDN
jgi:hypothetical protein